MQTVKLILGACLLLGSQWAWGQFNVRKFTRNDYKAGLQNWAIRQDKSGILYIANNEGLLTFDGANWQLFPLPNGTIVRSIAFGADGRLYAGGQDELGYFEPDPLGRLTYYSLLKNIQPAFQQFADIWNIVAYGNDVFFQASTVIFRLHNGQIYSFPTSSKWEFMGSDGKRLIAQDQRKGISQFIQNDWQTLVPAGSLPTSLTITALAPFQQAALVTTANHGLFMLSGGNRLTPFTQYATSAPGTQHFTSALALKNGRILLGTYDNGILYLDSLGNVLDDYTAEDGLNSNNIKCLFGEEQDQIWVGLEDGLSALDLNSPVAWLNPASFNNASGYGMAHADGNLYFALANGFYEMPAAGLDNLKNAQLKLRKIAAGLTWNVSNLQGRLLIGRDNGLFELKGGQLSLVDQGTGYWLCRSVASAQDSNGLAAGNYRGMALFGVVNGRLAKTKDFAAINASARFLEYDAASQTIWMSHPYRGVYKIGQKDSSVHKYTDKQGLPSALNNHVFKVKNQIVVATERGLYAYNAQSDAFKLSTGYDKIFKGISVRYLKDDADGNLWFVSGKKLGVVDANTQSLYFFPELERKILSGFENIFPLDKHHVFVGGENGFFVIDYARYLQRKTIPQVFVRQVTMRETGDSILLGGYAGGSMSGGSAVSKLSHQFKELKIRFSSPFSAQGSHIEYCYRLKGIDDAWSEWSAETERDYTHLAPGKYVFEVKARNNLNEESPVATFAFEVLTPWYKTIWARLCYLLLIASVINYVMKLRERIIKKRHAQKLEEEKRKLEEKQKLIEYQHQLEIEKSERELMRLRNEKLESELAASAMNLVQKREFLQKIKEEINQLNKSGNKEDGAAELKKISKELIADDKMNAEWEQFSLHFDQVHNNFLVTLKNKYPQLNAHDLKLCAYLRMNLSSKEMARMMSISVRGVEINRYRLRKKLQLQPKENIFDFLMNIGAGSDTKTP
jgi:ligand-binding sensor domain-containing protein/DNA-binding CsgD family transcriptional regulator